MEMSNQSRILEGKYAITNVRIQGGMSEVTKGITIDSGMPVAIKTWLPNSNPLVARESLGREARALDSLRHSNIVELIEFIRTDDQDYLILEWLEKSLYDLVQENSPLVWNEYFARIGRPLLEAVSYAHRNHWTHRDITPRNILIAEDGSPRIIDFGIGKQSYAGDEWNIVPGKTFRDSRTLGYSPVEPPVGIEAYRRDCYSLGAVSCYAVSGIDISNEDDLRIAFDSADFPEAIRAIISSSISLDVDQRYPMAGAMLEALNVAEDARWSEHRKNYSIPVSVIESVRIRLRRLVADEHNADVDQFLERELNEKPFCLLPPSEIGHASPDYVAVLDVYSSEWKFRCRISGIERNRLEIVDALKVGQIAIQRARDDYDPISVSFVLSSPSSFPTASHDLAIFLGELLTESKELAVKAEEYRIQSLYTSWRMLIRAQSTLNADREGAIRYVAATTDGDRATFHCDESLTIELLDQRRFVQSERGRIFGKVISVFEDSLVLDLLRGDGSALPSRGVLEVDTNAAERAVATQLSAIDRVQFGDPTNPALSGLLSNPMNATPPRPVSLDWTPQEPLDEMLRPIVEAAVGTSDIYVIEGPPGTGKTTLIARLIEQYLRVRPSASVLLTSQTHIAVDNVATKLLDTIGEERIVRIGQVEDHRINEDTRPLLLSRRVEAWATGVQERAYNHLVNWASDVGLNVEYVEAGVWIERILRCRASQASLVEQEMRLSEVTEQSADGDTSSDETTEAAITEIRSALRRLQNEEQEARRRLRGLGEDGVHLATVADDSELEDWKDLYFEGGDKVDECRVRIELLEAWFQRLGRAQDFQLPMLSEASVIAGTCVAVGGVRGIDQIPFDLCIVDEASKATAPESLIPMVLSKAWVLVGDPKQLPPFFDRSGDQSTDGDVDEEARRTILDRFLDPAEGLPESNKSRLSLQRRMVRPIGDLVSEVFYEGQLFSQSESHGWSVVPALPTPVTWITTSKLHERFERRYGSHSYQNLSERQAIQELLFKIERLAERLNMKLDVAVIAGYIGQVRILDDMRRQHVADLPNLNVLCNSVDSFQGQEADICVYSVTRSNEAGRLGFLREKPRLNVALSRGRSGLVIVGDHLFCRTARGENPFEAVVDYIENHPNDCTVVPTQC